MASKLSLGSDAYFSEVQQKRFARQRKFLFLLILIVCYVGIVAALWVVLRSGAFRVQKVTIEGNQSISSSEVSEIMRSIAAGKTFGGLRLGFNNMLSWPGALSEDQLRFIPVAKTVSIRKDYIRRSILISIRERKPFGIWCKHDSDAPIWCWWFDEEGIIFLRSPMPEGSLIRVGHDYSQNKVGLYQTIVPKQFVTNLFSIFDVLSSARIALREFKLNDLELQEIAVDTYQGPKLYFSLRFLANAALSGLLSLESSPGLEKLQYVDFRIANRVYYK